MEKRSIVTTSWDDGDRADWKLAELLRSRGIAATFYVPIQSYRRKSLSPADLRDLAAAGFEIGAHTVSHKLLTGLSDAELEAEISPCKPMLENLVGREVRMFCYPQGRYDANAVRAVKIAGYSGARTVRMLATRQDFDSFEMPTTVQSYPHSACVYLKNAIKARNFAGLYACLSQRSGLASWLELGKRTFDSVLKHGGIWHLYGHSWELDELRLWDDLRQLLDYVSGREEVAYITNSGLIPSQPALAAFSKQAAF